MCVPTVCVTPVGTQVQPGACACQSQTLRGQPHHWNAAPKAFVETESLLLGVQSWEKFAPYALVVISLVSLSSGILENPLLCLLYL